MSKRTLKTEATTTHSFPKHATDKASKSYAAKAIAQATKALCVILLLDWQMSSRDAGLRLSDFRSWSNLSSASLNRICIMHRV